MYERFTDHARNVMLLANQEAQRLKHEYIGTEHILLGLIKEGSGVAVSILKVFGVEPDEIMTETEKHIPEGILPVGLTDRLPLLPRAKKVIEDAMEEARSLNHRYVGTEHILLGLLREEEGVGAQVLMNLGLQLDKVREEIRASSQESPEKEEGSDNPPVSAYPRAEHRPMSVDKPPEACPTSADTLLATCAKCGEPHVVRVLWNRVHFSPADQRDVDTGRAILSYYSKLRKKPAWVCLRCSPKWSEVHALAMQNCLLQLAKENAVASEDYETAIKHRDAQLSLKQQLSQIVEELLKNQ